MRTSFSVRQALATFCLHVLLVVLLFSAMRALAAPAGSPAPAVTGIHNSDTETAGPSPVPLRHLAP